MIQFADIDATRASAEIARGDDELSAVDISPHGLGARASVDEM